MTGGKFKKVNKNNNKTISSFANLSNEEYVNSIINNAFPQFLNIIWTFHVIWLMIQSLY